MPPTSSLPVVNAVPGLLASDEESRMATLETLEAAADALPDELAIAAAPGLAEWLQSAASHSIVQRIGLLLARLFAAAAGAATRRGEEHGIVPTLFAAAKVIEYAWVPAEGSVLGHIVRKQPTELSREDALTYACIKAAEIVAYQFGFSPPWKATPIGDPVSVMLHWVAVEPMMNQKALPGQETQRNDDAHPCRTRLFFASV